MHCLAYAVELETSWTGHNDYGYQQPSYPEQGYDRPYEDSSQHYYEGGIYIPSHTYTYISPSKGMKILA